MARIAIAPGSCMPGAFFVVIGFVLLALFGTGLNAFPDGGLNTAFPDGGLNTLALTISPHL